VGWGDVDWIGLAQDRNRWRALVNSVLNLRVLWNAGKLSSDLTSSGLSISVQLRIVSVPSLSPKRFLQGSLQLHSQYLLSQRTLRPYNPVPSSPFILLEVLTIHTINQCELVAWYEGGDSLPLFSSFVQSSYLNYRYLSWNLSLHMAYRCSINPLLSPVSRPNAAGGRFSVWKVQIFCCARLIYFTTVLKAKPSKSCHYNQIVPWSIVPSTWLQIQKSGFFSRRYQIFWEVLGLERGQLSLVSTIEELFEEKVAAPE
jgi:hypothetical protein